MARLNIDYDQLKKDERIYPGLVDRLGEAEALLLLTRFWNSAQKIWGPGEPGCELMPMKTFKLLHARVDELIAVGLAEVREEGGEQRIYCAGAERRFAWYRASCRNSKAGGEATAAKKSAKASAAVAPPEPKGQPKGPPDGQPKGPPKGEPSSSLSFSTSENTDPLKSPTRVSGGSTVSRRDLANSAAAEVLKFALVALDAFYSGVPTEDALDGTEKRLTPLARELMRRRHSNWLVFCREFQKARKHGASESAFAADLRASFKANLDAALDAVGCRDGPEGAKVDGKTIGATMEKSGQLPRREA